MRFRKEEKGMCLALQKKLFGDRWSPSPIDSSGKLLMSLARKVSDVILCGNMAWQAAVLASKFAEGSSKIAFDQKAKVESPEVMATAQYPTENGSPGTMPVVQVLVAMSWRRRRMLLEVKVPGPAEGNEHLIQLMAS